MAKKKRSTTSEKKLKATVKALRAKLARAEAKSERWKARARRCEQAMARSETEVRKLTKRLQRASTPPPISAGITSTELVPRSREPSLEGPVSVSKPDSTWTVVRLRDEARARGLTGLSGKTKSQLLEILT